MSGSFVYTTLCNWIALDTPHQTDLSETIARKRTRFVKNMATDVSGIYARSSFAPTPHQKIDLHVRGADEWYILRQKKFEKISAFYRDSERNNIPLISSLSGSTVRWIHFIRLLGMKPRSQSFDFKRYTAAMVCYFIYCGHHSMHEMGYNIKLCGGEYTLGEITSLIPQDLLPKCQLNRILEEIEQQHPTKRRRSFSIQSIYQFQIAILFENKLNL